MDSPSFANKRLLFCFSLWGPMKRSNKPMPVSIPYDVTLNFRGIVNATLSQCMLYPRALYKRQLCFSSPNVSLLCSPTTFAPEVVSIHHASQDCSSTVFFLPRSSISHRARGIRLLVFVGACDRFSMYHSCKYRTSSITLYS